MTDETDLGIDGISQVRALDAGGFADVFEARDEFGRRVAIKVLKALDDAARRRFDRERSVMGMVAGHPHIVNPFTSGYTATGGRPYVVMEYLGGGSLQQRLDRDGPLPAAEAIAIVERIADALGASHRAGIIHKDVKPANILLTDDGTPKLADFGIASIRDVTTTTALAYSPAYTPPETFHADAGGDLRDERSDLYSLAATLFALVVGRGPFLTGNESAAAAMVRILNDPPPRTGYPDLDRFLATAMAKDPALRFPDATAFAQALGSVGLGPARSFEPPTHVAPNAWPGGASGPTPPAPGYDSSAPAPIPVPPSTGDPTTFAPPTSTPPVGAWPPPGAPAAAPAGYPAGPAGSGGGPIDSVPTTGGGRGPWLAAAAVVTALLLTAGAVIAITRADGDDDAATTDTEQPRNDPTTTETADGGDEPTTTAETSVPEETTPTLGEVGDLSGTTVRIAGPAGGDANIAGIEGALQVLSDETGIQITYEQAFNDELAVQVAGGNPPDIALFTQPLLLAEYVRSGAVAPVPGDVAADVASVWSNEWTDLGRVDGVQYGVPHRSDPKSLVWYKPARFAALGYDVPGSWDELLALTEQAIADGVTPWCVGIESGAATGWVFTDWVEDVLLRRHGADAYDQWVAGDLVFTDPVVIDSFQEVADLWSSPGAVHAASGTIVETGFGESGPALVDDACLMHRQAAFFAGFLPDGTPLADGTVNAVDVFYLPSAGDDTPIVTAGSWAGAFADRPEVWTVVRYLGSSAYANNRQAAQAAVSGTSGTSGFLTAANGLDRNLFSPLDNTVLDILAAAGPVRFDASDDMPAEVGADAFWSEGTAFVAGDIDAATAAARIDDAWP